MPKIVQKNNDCIYVGIDPGKAGGLVVIADDIVSYTVMPETERNLWTWWHEELGYSDTNVVIRAIVERVHAMPKQGVTSMFTFGQGYGTLRMFLTAIGASWEDIPPQTWMKALHVKKDKEADQKLKLLQFAQQLYPKLSLWTEPRSLGRQKAVCDALLIATYCKRKAEGNL